MSLIESDRFVNNIDKNNHRSHSCAVQTRTDTPVLDHSSQLSVEVATQPDNWIDAERVARENADLLPQPGATLLSSDRDLLAELVRVHKPCLLRAADKGLDPDQLRSPARSIILDS
jgi:hypothetical protein